MKKSTAPREPANPRTSQPSPSDVPTPPPVLQAPPPPPPPVPQAPPPPPPPVPRAPPPPPLPAPQQLKGQSELPEYYKNNYRPDLAGFTGGDNRKFNITEDALAVAASKLKRIEHNNAHLPNLRKKFCEEFSDVYDKHGISLVHTTRHLRDELISANVRSLDLAGIELLSDAFFFWLIEANLNFDQLNHMSLTGCVHLTDSGISWMMSCMPNLYQLYLNGCHNLTERSLLCIMKAIHTNSQGSAAVIEMMGSQVAVVPDLIGPLEAAVRLHGCPLVTPTNDEMQRMGHRFYNEISLEDFLVFKMVIICSVEFPFSLGELLVKDQLTEITATPAAHRGWSPQGLNSWNVFEINADMVEQDMFVSTGSVCVLPYLIDQMDQHLQQKLNNIALSLLNKEPQLTILPLGLYRQPSSVDVAAMEKINEDVVVAMCDFIMTTSSRLFFSLGDIIDKRWKVEGMDFQTQNTLALLARRQADIMSAGNLIMKAPPILINGEAPHIDRSILTGLLDKAAQRTSSLLPLYQKFGQEFLAVARNLPCTGPTPLSTVFKEVNNRAMLRKVLEICSLKGICLFFPEVDHWPLVTDMDQFCRLLNMIKNPPSLTSATGHVPVSCIGVGVACWREAELVEAVVKCCPHSALSPMGIVALLEKQNLFLRLPCDRQEEHSDPLVYILPEHLPGTPHIPLSHFWPNKKSISGESHDFQVGRYYTLKHGKSNSLIPAILRHCGKISEFTLLWQRGALIRLGAVDSLIELCNTGAKGDACDIQKVLFVGVRCPKPLSKRGERSVWAVLNQYTTIIDYVLHKLRVYARVSIPCKACVPSQDHHAVLAEPGAYHVSMVAAKSSYDLAMSCPGICSENTKKKGKAKKKRFTIEELIGPEYKTIVHRHDALIVQQDAKDYNYQEFTKCFQCQRCSKQSLWCPDAGSNGKTSRHCGCAGGQPLCPRCGVCAACTAYLMHVENTLRPPACPTDLLSKVIVNPSSKLSHQTNGNLVFYRANSSRSLVMDPLGMSPLDFSSFSVTLLQGNSLHIYLNAPRTEQTVFHFYARQGLVEKLTGHDIAHSCTTGSPVYDTQNVPACKRGAVITFTVCHPSDEGIKCRGAGARLTMLINGEEVACMDDVPLGLEVLLDPIANGSFLLSTPTLQRGGHGLADFVQEALLLYDYPTQDNHKKQLQLCIVKAVSDDGILTLAPAVFGDIGLYGIPISGWGSKKLPSREEVLEVERTSPHLHPVGVKLTSREGATRYNVHLYVLAHAFSKEAQKQPTLQSFTYEDATLKQILDRHALQIAPIECFSHNGTRKFVTNPYLHSGLFNSTTILPTPAALFCEVAQCLQPVNNAVFFEGTVDLIGRAFLYLPKMISSMDLAYPSRQTLSYVDRLEKRMHPLCYIRQSIGEQLQVPPPNKVGHETNIYWQLHVLDAAGLPMPSGVVMKQWRFLYVAWLVVLGMYPKIDVPQCSQLVSVTDMDSAPAPAQVSKWLQNYIHLELQLQMMQLHSPAAFINALSPKHISQRADAILDHVQEHLSFSGLTSTSGAPPGADPSWADAFPTQLLCEAHTASYCVGQQATDIDMNRFTPYAYSIRSIQFGDNQISQLPDSFFSCLPCLCDLQVNKNHLTSLPSGIGNCSNLAYISVNHNKLTDLPADFGALSSCLIRLDISDNNMTKLPPIITKLTLLEKLFASGMFLTELPDDIGDLCRLQLLHVGLCCLHRLPSSLVKLQNLHDLILNGAPWIQYHEMTKRHNGFLTYERFVYKLDKVLKKAIELAPREWMKGQSEPSRALFDHFDYNQDGMLEESEIGALNAHLYAMFPRLGSYDIGQDTEDTGQTPFSGFPPEILALRELRFLSLQNQGIRAVPSEIRQLHKLESLNLNQNPYLISLPAELGSLTLKRLHLEECPSLKTPPIEIRAKGFQAICGYLKRLQSGSVQCKRTKLMLVGLGGAGKTSLMRSLLSTDGRAVLAPGEAITDGIDITKWTIHKADSGQVTFSVWDFAGQTVYYNTHQFFLSNRAVYLLVWNVRLGYEHAGLDFWLSSISVHAPKAPIFVVGTHVDQVSRGDLPTGDMMERYPQIKGFYFISSHTGQGVRQLADALVITALQEPYMGENIPQVWLNLENAIISARSKGSDSVIKYSVLQSLASESGIFSQTEMSQAVQFLHELGSLQHFNNEFLKDLVVIDPQWIVDVMSCVVSVKDSPILEGKFYHRDMERVWSCYPADLHSWLLRLTEEFDLTFPLPHVKMNLVPCLLPDTQPQFDWPDVDPEIGLREAKIIYKFAYLPAGLFNRAQVRLYEFCDSSLIWKKGSFLRKNQHIALVLQTRKSDLLVKVHGPRPENIIFMVHEVFETLITESFKGVSYDFQLPCPDCVSSLSKEPYLFSASTIRRATEMKAPFLQCTKFFHTVTLPDLHALMPPDSNHDYDLHLVSAVHSLSQLKKDLCDDIFISCCTKDLEENQEFQTVDPRKIQQDLLAAGYKCYFQDPTSTRSMEESVIALRDSTVFMALISDSYAADERCCDLFTYARVTLGKPLILVVVGQGVHWQKSKMGILVSDEVFVSMQNVSRYPHKLRELLHTVDVKKRAMEPLKQVTQQYPPCFISYCWKNSQDAITKGSKSTQCALGHTDPRELRKFLEDHGIKCWIDIERAGKQGLFEDIAEGLKHARVVLACVSDEYTNSPNCVMEFRFASTVLKIPTVLATVGTKNGWRNSEVGMLSIKNPLPEINFQDDNSSSFDKLLQVIKAQLPDDGVDEEEEDLGGKRMKNAANEDQKNASFNELLELAQRKFLHQISHYADNSGELYPRLLVVDFNTINHDFDEKQDLDFGTENKKKPLLKRKSSSDPAGHMDFSFVQKSLMFKVLCEHEQGWHHFTGSIDAPGQFGESQLVSYSPYLARITAILKHSKNLYLNCTGSDEGRSYLHWLEELPQARLSDFAAVYQDFRRQVMEADHELSRGSLSRCHLPSGKTVWLCPEHQKMTRVTVLTNDILLDVDPGLTRSLAEETMMHQLQEVIVKEEMSRYRKHWPHSSITKDYYTIQDIHKVKPKGEDQSRDGSPSPPSLPSPRYPTATAAAPTPASMATSAVQPPKHQRITAKSTLPPILPQQPIPASTHTGTGRTVRGKELTNKTQVAPITSGPELSQPPPDQTEVVTHSEQPQPTKSVGPNRQTEGPLSSRKDKYMVGTASPNTENVDEGGDVMAVNEDAHQYRKARAKFRAAAVATMVSANAGNHNKTSVCDIL